MARFLLGGAALMLAALPGAAWAQDDAPFDCAVNEASSALKRSIAESAMGGAEKDAQYQQGLADLTAIADGCIARFHPDEEQKASYLDYNVARILRDWMAGELAGFGLSASVVDNALDFGPGRGNPRLLGAMSEEQVKTLVQALIDGGIDTENISSAAWETVGTYAAATSVYWRLREQLSFGTAAETTAPDAGAIPVAAARPASAEPAPPAAPASAGPAAPAALTNGADEPERSVPEPAVTEPAAPEPIAPTEVPASVPAVAPEPVAAEPAPAPAPTEAVPPAEVIADAPPQEPPAAEPPAAEPQMVEPQPTEPQPAEPPVADPAPPEPTPVPDPPGAG